jgi:uracil-DNA glycosylase
LDPERIRLDQRWKTALADEFDAPYMKLLRDFLVKEKAEHAVYPPGPEIFAALDLVPPEDVRVVILGQDPYHGPGQAHGLSFSVKPGVAVPPSLQNIYKELQNDLGIAPPRHGFLESWAKQGVLLLNDSLTVRHRAANSHKGAGWERFTDAVIRVVNAGPPTVFLLWGAKAKAKAASVDRNRHLVITTSHPSPLGDSCNKGFFGSRPFSHANAFLEEQGRGTIDWALPASVS